jgi:hypothetical protein
MRLLRIQGQGKKFFLSFLVFGKLPAVKNNRGNRIIAEDRDAVTG